METRQTEHYQRIQKMLSNPDFQERLRNLKGYIAHGMSLPEARVRMGIKDTRTWDNLRGALGIMTAEPVELWLEYKIKAEFRYAQYATARKNAEGRNDFDLVYKYDTLMFNLDKSIPEVAQALGVLEVMKNLNNSITQPLSEQESLENARQLRDALDEKLRGPGTIIDADSVGLQPDVTARREADNMDEIPVAPNDSRR